MFGNRFYHSTTRRYVAMFGTLFNDIVIERKDNNNQVIQRMKVPIHYAPMQKVLSRIEGDPNLNRPAMTLPRMSFEIINYNFSPERKLTSLTKNRYQTAPNTKISQYVPAPYDIEFQLNIMVKHQEDGTKILEQILPFFKPDITASVRLIDELDLKLDVPIILNSVVQNDEYEGDYLTRRTLTYTIGFTVRGYYFGPTETKKVIKFVDTPLRDTETNEKLEDIQSQPGLTADGEPTNILLGRRATATTQVANGQISAINLVDTGFAYEEATITINPPSIETAQGGGLVGADEQVTSFAVTNPGGHYNTTPAVTFAAPTLPATPAEAYSIANTSTNELQNAVITFPGRYYNGAPSLDVSEPPASVQATAQGSITAGDTSVNLTITEPGTNYSVSPTVTVEYEYSSGNTLITDTSTETASVSNYQISNIPTVSLPNGPTTRIISVSIDAPAQARKASGLSTISQGKITGVVLQDRGFGYAFNDSFLDNGQNVGAPVAEYTFGAPTGLPASFSAQGTANVVNGEVVDVNITDGGMGYDSGNPPSAIFDAPQSITATANVVVDTAVKEVSGFTITNPGAGYKTAASALISQPDEVTIPFNQISEEDNWGYIVEITEST